MYIHPRRYSPLRGLTSISCRGLRPPAKIFFVLFTINNGHCRFGRSAGELMTVAAKRQYELSDPAAREELAAARAVLRKHSLLLLTASKAYVKHPELGAARANRDWVLGQVSQAVDTISEVAQGRRAGGGAAAEEGGHLARQLGELEARLALAGELCGEQDQGLEAQLEVCIGGAALLADLPGTREERRERIVEACSGVREAMQQLVVESSPASLDRLGHGHRALARQLRRAAADGVSDAFLDTGGPLEALVGAAERGDEVAVEVQGRVFSQHCCSLVEASLQACTVSGQGEGGRMVRCAALQLESLCPQVLLVARLVWWPE